MTNNESTAKFADSAHVTPNMSISLERKKEAPVLPEEVQAEGEWLMDTRHEVRLLIRSLCTAFVRMLSSVSAQRPFQHLGSRLSVI